MSITAEWTYRYVELTPEQSSYARNLVERGDVMLGEGKGSPPQWGAWTTEFLTFVRSIDPLGENYSGSISSAAHDAQWLHGNSPKSVEDQATVFGRCLGVARSLLTGPVKIVASKSPGSSGIESRSVFHHRRLEAQDDLVFVLMPFKELWSDYIWTKEIKRITEAVPEGSLVCKRADDLYGQDVMVDVYESIATAKIIIAEVTGKNPNVFYELGLAHALGKDVILLTQEIDDIPFDLRRFRHFTYSNDGPGYERLRQWLPSAIRDVLLRSHPPNSQV